MAARGLPADDAKQWSSLAAGWQRWWQVWERAAQPVSDRLVALAGIGPDNRVLDLATGLGEPAMTAARCVGPRGTVVATDCSLAMLRLAARRAEMAKLSNIEFRVMDAQTPDLERTAFDAILCRWGFMFVPDLEGSLRRLTGLLRPGGRLAAAVWGVAEEVPLIHLSASVLAGYAPLPGNPVSPLNPFRLSERGLLADAMKRAGFTNVREERLPVTFEFGSAEDYTRFRRDMTGMDGLLAEHHPPEVVEAAWQAVTRAARAHATAAGRIRFVNTAICVAGSCPTGRPSRRIG